MLDWRKVIINTNQKKEKNKNSSAIKIKSIQAASLYRYNNNYKFKIKKEDNSGDILYKDSYLDFGNAVINNSLFAEFVRKHGVIVDRNNSSVDFIMMKFDWGVDKDDSNERNIKPAKTSKELREYYYKTGASITWKKYNSKTGEEIVGTEKTVLYKMLMRSPGKAKEGHCLFIRDTLLVKVRNYLTMGLWDKMKNEKGAQIVEMSAYAPLITATAISYINIPMENIFVLKDEEVSVYKKAFTVKERTVEKYKNQKDYPAFEEYINQHNLTFYKKKVKINPELTWINKKDLEAHGINKDLCPIKMVKYNNKECYVDRESEESKITNTLWDGMGLIDNSIFPKGMEGFIYCRSHFFKSCLFRGNIQQYFKDHLGERYDTTYVTDMIDRKIKVTDIKVIVTENSLKWMKFINLMSKTGTLEDAFKCYDGFMKKDGERFAIVKTAHPSKWGDLQRSSFQINNTLLTTNYEILGEIARESINYCNQLKLDNEAFLQYLAITGTAKYSINNVLIDLYQLNSNFKYMEYFKLKKDSKINEFKNKRLRLGKLLQNGDNLTICGNPIAMLMKVTQQEGFLEEKCFKQIDNGIQCYTTRFADGEKIAGFRSPHNSPNNIVHLENVYPEPIKKYFPDLGRNVIVINGIETDIQSRLNGQDLDTDAIYATNQKHIVDLARKAYMNYPTIINGINPKGASEYDKSMESYAEMDSNISSAQYAIGSASNIAQLGLSYYFDEGCNNQELEDIFIICSVLAQVAIDSAKRNFEINVNSELLRIAQMPCMKHKPKYPVFYADVQKNNNQKKKGKKLEIKESDIGHHNCPMDILYKIIDEGVIDLRKHKELNTVTFSEKKVGVNPIFEYKADKVKTDRKQYKKIISIVEAYDKKVGVLDVKSDTYHKDCINEFDVCMDKFKNITIGTNTMYSLIAYAFKPGNEKIRDSIFTVLYDKDKKSFLKCFKKTEESSQKNAENVDL
ncbi:hypothetical protein [Kineothrix sp. MB12-C1]|uniref:hypothetical protein n=1 Tax=Kineothrix sp. MB12-C1 TaxID=3070215 RepID=UPI0027D31C5D|nr:hypothetical protein [Kineothrix sp. MB12-C1]WMC93205.1 hypothetical protein RBB56_02665 [Kineothrix sp. MB12-C1]